MLVTHWPDEAPKTFVSGVCAIVVTALEKTVWAHRPQCAAQTSLIYGGLSHVGHLLRLMFVLLSMVNRSNG